MEIGIVGLPNVGKSSLFNALTGAGIAAENFPFTTIEPNIGIVPLPDERLRFLAEKFNSQKIVPAGIRFLDIAGLVKGASKGEGLGNKFLGNIRSVDAICHVVRCFEDDNVVNVMDKIDPAAAVDTIETELLLADLQQAEKGLERFRKNAKTGEKSAKDRVTLMEEIIARFNEGVSARNQDIPEDILKEFQFLTAKPVLYVANTDERGGRPELMAPLTERAEKENARVIELCTKLESEILELPEEDREAYYEEAGIISPGLTRLAQAGEKLLGLVTFFTAGPEETRAWHIRKGTTAQKAAGKIHTDIERGFIRAETYSYSHLREFGEYSRLQAKGLVRLEGKEYEVRDGDVIYFRFSV
jgi:GTP-binding protein YchF